MTMSMSKDVRRSRPEQGRREQRRDAHPGRDAERELTPPMGLLALELALGKQAAAKLVAEQPSSPIQARGVTQTVPFTLSRQGSGNPLDPSAQGRLEGAVGGSLADIRVHEDGQAERIGAQALTRGSDIHVARGHYRPDTPTGYRLLAHEIAHVVQQREGRAPAVPSGAVISDPALESAAEDFSARAGFAGGVHARQVGPDEHARHSTTAPQADAQAARPGSTAVQPVAPALAFLGLSAAAWELAGTVAGVVTTVAGAGAGVYSAVARKENAFGSYVFPQNVITGRDTLSLQQIAQFEIINKYVELYLNANPEVRAQLQPISAPPPAPSPAPTPGPAPAKPSAPAPAKPPSPAPAPAAAPAPGTTPTAGAARPTGAPTAAGLDEAVLGAVKISVERRLQAQLEGNKKTTEKEFMWGEDDTRGEGPIEGSGKAETFGVTGFLRFRNVEGVALKQQLMLTPDAKLVLGSVQGEGEVVIVRRLVGGSLGGHATWSAWDNLTVNVEGGQAQQSFYPNGSPMLIIRTLWYWDQWGTNSETWMQTLVGVDDDGTPSIHSSYEGTPG